MKDKGSLMLSRWNNAWTRLWLVSPLTWRSNSLHTMVWSSVCQTFWIDIEWPTAIKRGLHSIQTTNWSKEPNYILIQASYLNACSIAGVDSCTAVLYYACPDIWGNGGRSRFCGNNSWILSSSCKWAVLAHVFLSGEGADSRQLFTKFLWVRGTRSLPAATRPQPVHSRSSLTTPSTIKEEDACRFVSGVLRYSLRAFVELVTLKVKTRPS